MAIVTGFYPRARLLLRPILPSRRSAPIGLAIVLLTFLVLAGGLPQESAAACTSTDQCDSDRVCMAPKNLPGLPKECRQLPCNVDGNCPSERPRCLMGACRNPGFNPNAPPGAGTPQAGLGESCGPYKIGPITKSRGCLPGLQCLNGHCQRPAQ